jgi:hypothetical protein
MIAALKAVSSHCHKSRIVLFTLFMFALIVGFISPSSAQAQSLAQMEKIMWEATEMAMAEFSPHEVEGFRALILGSWVNKTGGPGSDIDITFAHADLRLEKKLVTRINHHLGKITKGKKPPINVMNKSDFLNDEFYRGATGQKLIHDLADATADGTGCVTFSLSKNKSGLTQVSRQRKFTGSYWSDVGDVVPKKLIRPHTFFEDNVVFIRQHIDDLARMDQKAAMVAKYINRADDLVVPGLQSQWRTNLQQLRLNTQDKSIAQILLKNKSISNHTQRQLQTLKDLKKLDPTITNIQQMNARLSQFVDDGTSHLTKLADDVQVVDWAVRTNKIKAAGGASKLLKVRDKIWGMMKKHGKKLFVIADALMVMNAYYGSDPSQGPNAGLKAAALELTTIGIGHACPPALLVAMVAELGRQVFSAVGTWSGQKIVFEPINNTALKETYDPNNPCYIFKMPGTFFTSRPGRMVTRENLYCVIPDRDHISTRVRMYLKEAKGMGWNCARYATAGAGSFEQTLTSQMHQDWYKSQVLQADITAYSLRARAGFTTPPMVPVAVEASPSQKTVKTGRTAVFNVGLLRNFGLTERLKPETMDLQKAWCKLGGRAEMVKYQKENTEILYDTGGNDLKITINVRGARGWRLSGSWPVPWPALDAAGNGSSRGKLTMDNPMANLPQVLRRFKFGLTPGKNASATAVVMVSVRWVPVEDKKFQPKLTTFTITAHHQKKQDEEPEVPEDRLKTFRFKGVKARWTKEGWEITGTVVATNLNPPKAIPEEESITVLAEVAKGPGASYPALPSHVTLRPPKGMSGLMIGKRHLSKAEVAGRNIAPIVMLDIVPRKIPVYLAYGGLNQWRKKAPNTVSARFKGVIPQEYAGKSFRIRATLRQMVGGPNAAWEAVGFRHQILGRGTVPKLKPKHIAGKTGRWGGMLKLWDQVMDIALEFWEGLEFELSRPGSMQLPDGTTILATEGDLGFAVNKLVDRPNEYSYDLELARNGNMASIMLENKDRKIETFDLADLDDESLRLDQGAKIGPGAKARAMEGEEPRERLKMSYRKTPQGWKRKKGVFTGKSGRLNYGAPHSLGIHGSGGYNLMGNKHPKAGRRSPRPLPRDMRLTVDQTYLKGGYGALKINGSMGQVVSFEPDKSLVINRSGSINGWTGIGTKVGLNEGKLACLDHTGKQKEAGIKQIKGAVLNGCPTIKKTISYNPKLWTVNREGRHNAVSIGEERICILKSEMGMWTKSTKPAKSNWQWPVAAAVKQRPGALVGDYQISFEFSTKLNTNNNFYLYRDDLVDLMMFQSNRLRWRDRSKGRYWNYWSKKLIKGRWYKFKLICRPSKGSYDVYIDGKRLGVASGIKPGKFNAQLKNLMLLGSRDRTGFGQGCWRKLVMLPMGASQPITPSIPLPEGGRMPELGRLERIDCPKAIGWAKDPDEVKPVWVELWTGKRIYQGRRAVTGWAEIPRPQLPYASKKHGFSLKLPVWAKAGEKVYAYALDPFTENPVLLQGAPLSSRCAPIPQSDGSLDAVDCQTIRGKTKAEKAWIEIYLDGDRKNGHMIYRGWTEPGGVFTLPTPAMLKDEKYHALKAYAFEQPGGKVLRLSDWERRVRLRCRKNHSPQGNLDIADCRQIRGWARDPDDTRAARVILDAVGPDGRTRRILTSVAMMPRPDLPFADKNHGFQLATPTWLKNGEAYQIRARAYDTWDNHPVNLTGSGRMVRCAGGDDDRPNRPPQGRVTRASCGQVQGWAIDPDENLSLMVVLIADKPMGRGRTLGKTTANLTIAGLPAKAKGRGFSMALPAWFKNGQRRPVYAYALDSTSTAPAMIGGGPLYLACSEADIKPPPGDHEQVCPRINKQQTYQWYIAAYNRLTSLMAQGKGDTPEAQKAYAAYKKAKDCYEKSQKSDIVPEKKLQPGQETEEEPGRFGWGRMFRHG